MLTSIGKKNRMLQNKVQIIVNRTNPSSKRDGVRKSSEGMLLRVSKAY